MKHSLIIIFSVLSIFTGFAVPDNPNPASNQMRIKIGSSTFTATLYDNATATAFKGMLPMTIKMSELNGNEKYFDLSVNPADKRIQSRKDSKRRFDDLWF
jgi:hypothetical protein